MIKLSYSSNGLTELDLNTAIAVVEAAGYFGIELSFDQQQFNPFLLTESELFILADQFKQRKIKPACIATPTLAFLSDRPHEPSIMCLDLAGQKQRIDLIKRGIKIAKILGAPIVSFGSGFLRDEHLFHPEINPRNVLLKGIYECLADLKENESKITLVIEPEPGMYIETVQDGIDLVREVNSDSFKLHLDLCHVVCSEYDYLASIATATPYTKYLHLSDTKDGCNVKFVQFYQDLVLDFLFASYLIYFPNTANFLFINQDINLYFYDKELTVDEKKELEFIVSSLLVKAKSATKDISSNIKYVKYADLYAGTSIFSAEINTYVVSVPNLSFYVLDRAKPILRYLRDDHSIYGNKPILNKMLANTLTGKVHFHAIPGHGDIDFKQCFTVLKERNFSGYATVELYHHISQWQQALEESITYLAPLLE